MLLPQQGRQSSSASVLRRSSIAAVLTTRCWLMTSSVNLFCCSQAHPPWGNLVRDKEKEEQDAGLATYLPHITHSVNPMREKWLEVCR